MTKKIVFHSYKGGSGKTLLSLNVAYNLAEQGHNVLLVECDFTMPSFTTIFEGFNPTIFLEDYFIGNDSLQNHIYEYREGLFDIVFSNENFTVGSKLYSNDQEWFFTQLKRLNEDILKLDYDYVIFDASPGFQLLTVNLIMISNVIMLIARPDYHSYGGTIQLLEKVYARIKQLNSLDIHLIINQIPNHEQMRELIETWLNILSSRFQFLTSMNKIDYSSEIAYYSAINQFIIPEDQEYFQSLTELVQDMLI